jgi:hypothetical protein
MEALPFEGVMDFVERQVESLKRGALFAPQLSEAE